MIPPRNHVSGAYRVTLDRPRAATRLRSLRPGRCLLEGDDRLAASVRDGTLSEMSATVTLTEGRYHQVRRMFAAMEITCSAAIATASAASTFRSISHPADRIAGEGERPRRSCPPRRMVDYSPCRNGSGACSC